jgi:hypothetical protein
LATAAARPAGCGGMLAKGVYKHRKPSGREGRKPSVEGEGPSADGRGTGRAHDERGAKRSGCVSAGIPLDRSDRGGPPRDIGAATPTSLRWLRDPLRCPHIAELVASAAVVAEGPSEQSGKSGRVKNSKRAKLVGSRSESGPIVDRCGFFSLGPTGDMADGSSGTWPDCPERYSLKIDARRALSI